MKKKIVWQRIGVRSKQFNFSTAWGSCLVNYRITESQNNWGWKGPQEISSPISFSKQSQLWYQTKLLRAFSSWILKTSKDGNSMTLLCRLLHCLAVLMGRNFILCSQICSNFSLPVIAYSPRMHHCEEPALSPASLFVGTGASGRCPWSCLFSMLNKSCFSSLRASASPPNHPGGPLLNLLVLINAFLVLERTKTRQGLSREE